MLSFVRLLLLATAVLLSCVGVHAEAPEGPPIPSADLTPNVGHSRTNLGLYVATRFYRYRGDYSLTYNAFHAGRLGVYGFGDVDVEARTASNEFQPDRLTGTFEIGTREAIQKSSLGLYYRHFSSHNIDLIDRPKPSWEQAGLRYQWVRPRYEVDLSGGDYVHIDNCRYQTDGDLRLAGMSTRVGGFR